MKTFFKGFDALLYAAGVLCVLALCAAALLRAPYVPFPDAMLPATLGELAVGWLAVGAVPMALATALLCYAFPAAGGTRARRWLLSLPALICAACLLGTAAVWAAGTVGTLARLG